jgi:hypothetical protein
MLTRRARAGVVAAVVLAGTMAALVSTPVAAATVPASTGRSVMLPDTSAATAGPVVGSAAIKAVPTVAQAAPARAAAAAAPTITVPFLSDGFCSYAGQQLSSCTSALLGSYDPLDNCFWKVMVPQPPPGDPLWQGQSSAPPAKLYTVTCETHNGTNIGNAAATIQYSPGPPLNYNQSLNTNQTIAATALNVFVNLIALAPVPATGSAPPPGNGVAGVPVWMWTDVPPALWDQKSASITVVFTKVSLSFQGEQVDWDMGDGHHVMCSTPGTAYTKPAFPNVAYKVYSGQPGPSPDCGYTYQTAGSYGVTSTATWFIAFQVGSTKGTFVVSRTTKITMMNIGELQAVTE